MKCARQGCHSDEALRCVDCDAPLCMAHYVACARCLLHTCRPCHDKNHAGRKQGTCGAACGQDGCRETADLVRCIHCTQLFCASDRPKCARCWSRTCAECAGLFHATEGECIQWPSPLAAQRRRVLTLLKQSRSHRRPFIRFVRRHGFLHECDRIYVVITALQRGDFHKFKWSIGADRHLFALLPLHEEHADAWFDDMVGRAEALEQVAEGRWQFIHSSLVVSRRDKSGKASGRGHVLSGLARSKLAVDIALADDDEGTWQAFHMLAADDEPRSTLYNIDSFVPFYNSPLVMKSRSAFLESPSDDVVRAGPCEALLALLFARVKDRAVLVLWGTRTKGRGYLDPQVVAREFRHKTSKSLVRHLLAQAREHKTCILAGEPLSGVDADLDLTMMWDAKVMRERHGVECAFGRLEQEYIFFHLAKAAANTLHIGMQSGNIEPLINNPRTNVICVNENSVGGAGLSNVEKISATRHKSVTRSHSADGNRLPSNLYLSFNLKVLPSAIGELARRLMEKYEENVTMRQGLRRVLQEIFAIFGVDDAIDTSALSIEELFIRASQLLDDRTIERRGQRATVDLLLADHEHELEQIILYFADKLSPERKRLDKPERDGQEALRAEVQLLGALAASIRPRVQFAIHVLNNELTAPAASARESSVRFAITYLERHKLLAEYKQAHEGAFTRLPKDPEPRLRALLETMGAAIAGSTDEKRASSARADVNTIKLLLDGGSPTKLGLKKFPTVDRAADRLRSAWQRLRPLGFDSDEKRELAPVLVLLKQAAGVPEGERLFD